ncbi:hypothetical protein [Alkalibacillus salilacus]|uniref:Membrane protein n=1 Tax=Alkalibacillus salilacus TaxID=284582 RepID=A0ABT9VEZ9_9BACI|nr:hypothetical protein [Alkalibacillus salilacus]MDQ0159482.1 putative membrane protein [Alkalibacillus salilacus]
MKKSLLGVVSTIIPFVLLVLIINFFLGLVPIDKIQGLPLIFPIILCPIGAIIGFVSYRLHKDKLSLIGIVFNIILFLFPIVYHVFGILAFGV